MPSHFPTFRRWFDVLRGRHASLSPPPQARVSRGYWPWHTTAPQRQALMRLIAAAVESNEPLAPLLKAWAVDERGVQRRRVDRLAGLIADGTPLPEAIEQSSGALANEDVLAVRFGQQSGTLAASLHDAADSLEPADDVNTPSVRSTIRYFAVVGIIAIIVAAYFAVRVAPSFVAITDDFSVEQSPSFKFYLKLIDLVSWYWLLGAVVLALIAWAVRSLRRGGIVRSLVDAVTGSVRQELAADVLRKLGVAARAGRPLAGAISTLARYHFDAATRHKLLVIRNEVEHGADPWQSMVAEGLIDRDEGAALATADRLGNRPWVLRQLALSKRTRLERRRGWWGQLALPALVLAFGAFALLQALAVFTSLTNIVEMVL